MDQEKTTKADIAQLIGEHQRLLYKVANSYCKNPHEQEDLIQEIIFQLIKSYPNFDHGVKVTTWMYKVSFNVALSQYRKNRTRHRYMVAMPDQLINIQAETEPTTDPNLIKLQQYIQELEPLNRALLIMYLDGNSHAEIAQAMGISSSNVGTKIGRIKEQLKKRFQNQ